MRKLLITAAAGMAMIAAAGTASAMPGSASNGIAVDNPITNVAICFYLDGWNGPGLYDCGFRHDRRHHFHGKRHDGHHDGHHNGKHHSSKHHDGKKKHH